MRDLSLWRRRLEPECQRLEPHDPRFQDAVALAQRRPCTEAADAVEALLAEHLYDARLLGYPFFAALEEDGLRRLPELLEALAECIRLNWSELPAGDKQAVLLDKGLGWLFRTLLDTLAYHQARQDERWQAWVQAFSEPQAAEALQRLREVQSLLEAEVYRPSAELLVRLGNWLQELKRKLAQPPPQAQAPSEPPAPRAPPPSTATFLRLGQEVRLHGSAQFVELCNRLKAFELLIQRKEFEKAALVSDDILSTLENFDPRQYFPELFATFGALLYQNVQVLQKHWGRKESVEWKTLSQFYEVDLEGFVGREE